MWWNPLLQWQEPHQGSALYSVSHEKEWKKKYIYICKVIKGRLKATDVNTLKRHPFMMIALTLDSDVPK